jgi:hypothetical protein
MRRSGSIVNRAAACQPRRLALRRGILSRFADQEAAAIDSLR